MENQNPNQNDQSVTTLPLPEPEAVEDYVPTVPRKLEITLREAEVLKITPEPGDVLFFKFKGDGFMDGDVNEIGKQLRQLFPANKVVVMALPDNSDVELTTIKKQDKVVESDCSKPDSYCADCSCGKKERATGTAPLTEEEKAQFTELMKGEEE